MLVRIKNGQETQPVGTVRRLAELILRPAHHDQHHGSFADLEGRRTMIPQCSELATYFLRPRMTSSAPVSNAKALPVEPPSISGTAVTARAKPEMPTNSKAIPAIFTHSLH